MRKFIFVWLTVITSTLFGDQEPKHFSIFMASYNNSWIARTNIRSVLRQNYPNFHIYYVNDCSTDNTIEIIREEVAKEKKEHLITIIDNKERKGAMRNQYEVVHKYIQDDSIIVIVDGDDALANPNVLTYLDGVYSQTDREIWMTYGQFMGWQSGGIGFNSPYPEEVIEEHSFRDYVHFPSHLRTYYSWIFKKIKKEDFFYEGDFVETSADLAVMLPIVEMSANRHFQFIPEILYLYNEENPISDHRAYGDSQMRICDYIRSRPAYQPL